jgi:pimeloyl-ACP methyl ester carboxylesterase
VPKRIGFAPRRFSRVLAACFVVSLVVSACADPNDDPNDPQEEETSSSPSTSAPEAGGETAEAPSEPPGAEDLSAFYEQEVRWQPCPTDETSECATVDAPLDYNNPAGQRISVAIARIPATSDDPQGSILINPGGPGASGVGDYLSIMAMSLPAEVTEVFDVVGFDPRGVGETVPVSCLDDAEMTEYLDYYPTTFDAEGIREMREVAESFGEACLANTGEALGFVDSGSTARDMDLIRAAVGDEKLNYLGVSYGTYLGALYAERFPERVGRMVLDAAVDPTAEQGDEEVTQLAGFENAMRSFVAACLDSDLCPLSGTVDEGMAAIHDFIAERQDSPLPTVYGRQLTLQMALMAVLVAMYEDAAWPMLMLALASGMESGDGTALMELADLYFDRDSETGEYTTNMFDAFLAISCLDSPVDARISVMEQRMEQMRQVAPTLADFSAYGAIGCAEWPFPAVMEPHQVSADGADPIVVIGTTGDPATPFENAEVLAGGFSSGVLVTFEGEGHGAVGRSNECVNDMLNDYYIKGQAPPPNLTC